MAFADTSVVKVKSDDYDLIFPMNEAMACKGDTAGI